MANARRKSTWVLVFTLLFLSAFSAHQTFADACDHDDKTFRCVVFDHAYDSDTITFNIPKVPAIIGRKIGVRVYGIDSPEIHGKNACEKAAAQKAKALVIGLMTSAKRIDLVNVKKDKYFRLLSNVSVDGQDLSELLIKKGFAYPYFGDKKKVWDWCPVSGIQ